jgi:hypothetical protein
MGKIKSYGISSNTFVLPKEDKNVINLETVLNKKEKYPNFKSIQFPFNLLELGALENQFSGVNLIQFAKINTLEVMINRPLNAFTQKGLVRLAEYENYAHYNDDIDADTIFAEKTKTLKERFEVNKEDPEDKLEDIALLNQIKGFWHKQISKDAVDQIFFGHFFPLIASIWGEDLTSDESADFYDLYGIACNYARKHMNTRALVFKEQAMSSGLLDNDSTKTLQQLVIDKYSSYDIDLCFIGMRETKYVKDFL